MKAWLRVASVILAAISISVGAQAQQAPRTYGTTYTSYVRVPAVEFLPLNSGDGPYVTTGTFGTSGQITRYGSGNSFFAAPVNLPSGASIVSIELDYCDNDSGSNRSSLTLVQTDYLGNVLTTTPSVYSVYPGCGYEVLNVSASGIVVNNNTTSCHLIFYHNIGDGGESIAGAIVGYVLQVSPAPGAPSFGDVPPSHPFFQFIEALKASGITGGCGGGNYCPDNPVTRGQMAVFLAKALGLAYQ